jgi:hypothetical protein
MDKLATASFCRSLNLRLRDYREHAEEFRNWALDTNDPDAREMYLHRARQQEFLAAKAERFLADHLGPQHNT